jgi:hypothetical protein
MIKQKHFVLFIVIILMNIIFIVIVTNLSSFFPGCEDVLDQEIFSMDKQNVVRIFTRDCGATTSYATIIVIDDFRSDSKTKYFESENIVATIDKINFNDLKWKNNKTLLIAGNKSSFYIHKNKWRNIDIEYYSK